MKNITDTEASHEYREGHKTVKAKEIIKADIDPGINPINKILQNGQKEKTGAQKCMDEMQPILERYNCQIICIPQKMYGQTVYVPVVEEIKP